MYLHRACPNARFGYSDEGLAYLQYMRNQDLRNIPNTPYYQGVPVQMRGQCAAVIRICSRKIKYR